MVLVLGMEKNILLNIKCNYKGTYQWFGPCCMPSHIDAQAQDGDEAVTTIRHMLKKNPTFS